jgi:selenocysteine lyase/cysteine desulfurase
MNPESLYAHPNALAAEYSRFRVAQRILLTGHSHQAWPDCSREAQLKAWDDAADYVDGKWERAFTIADEVRKGFARLLKDPAGYYALGANTHELLVRFLSALPLATRPRLVTTDGEFYTIRRQLARFQEAGIVIVRVPAQPASQVAQRLADALDDQTAAVLVSSVFYQTGHIVPGLSSLMEQCNRVNCPLLIDVYHHLNVIPFDIVANRLQEAFIIGGGYKYCQLGEGNCFLRFPRDCQMRPVVTGWFAEFANLEQTAVADQVLYEDGPARFAGSTYDPTAHYRAAAVFEFFKTRNLTPELLREVSQHQVELLMQRFDAAGFDPGVIRRDTGVTAGEIGGFLTFNSSHAAALQQALKQDGVHVDVRGQALRLGPAPYLSDQQLHDAMTALSDAVSGVKQGK